MTAVPALSVENLSVEFRTRSGVVRALERVSFTVGKGETLALVGESGSGKSVTAYAVMGILDPAGRVTGGKAMLGGLDLLGASPDELAKVRGREIAMIFQNPRTAASVTRLSCELVSAPPISTRETRSEAVATARCTKEGAAPSSMEM